MSKELYERHKRWALDYSQCNTANEVNRCHHCGEEKGLEGDYFIEDYLNANGIDSIKRCFGGGNENWERDLLGDDGNSEFWVLEVDYQCLNCNASWVIWFKAIESSHACGYDPGQELRRINEEMP